MKKKMAWFFSLSFAILPLLLGCSIFDSVARDNDGYYIKHLKSCGPEAIEKALIEYYKRKGIAYCVRADQISRQIQDKEQFLKKLLILFDNKTVRVTWSWEIKKILKKYGFKLINVNNFEKLDPKKDIAFVLVRGKFFSREWHWMCYPVEKNIRTFYGPDTKINAIYLLKRI